ncbi:hypothetical protein Tco_1221080 [Tanacetum coccineum]
MSKQRFASQVDVNKNLLKPVTQHYLPKNTESACTKPDHMIASSSSRNSSKNMPRFSSNDMVHNHYLDVAKKKIQERDRNSTTSVTTSARFKALLMVANQNLGATIKHLGVCLYLRCVFNANHDACITKLLKEINSRATIQSHKTRNSNKPVDQKKSILRNPDRHRSLTGHRFSPNKTSAVYEKTSPDLIFSGNPHVNFRNLLVLKVDSYRNVNSTLHKASAGTSINIQKEQSLDLSAVTTFNELELLYSPMFSELLNGTSHVVSKSSAVHAADNPDKRQQHNTTHTSTTTDVADLPPLNIHSTHQTPTQVSTVTAPENIIQAETNTKNAQFDEDEFINIFSTPVQEQGETSSRHVDSSNMHTFYQHHPLLHNVGQKDHPLEQVM